MATLAAYVPDSLWLVGGGGHALVVMEAALLAGHQVVGYFDDRQPPGMLPCAHLGTIAEATSRLGEKMPHILAIGDLLLRAQWLQRLPGPFASVVHPTSILAASVQIAPGSFVAAGAVINSSARLASHVIVNTRAVIEHDCSLVINSHVGPGAILGGGVAVGQNTLIGIHASVRPNIVIGNQCTIGAGAVVVRDVPDGTTVVGVPARPVCRAVPHRKTA